MARGFRVSTTIDRPHEEVWAYLTDLSRAPDWMKGVTALTPADGAGPYAGARYIAQTDGRFGSTRDTVVSLWQPPELFALRSEQGGISAIYEYSCQPQGSGTLVTLDAQCTARGMLWTALRPLIAYLMARSDRDQLERLRQAIEGARGT